MNVYDKLPEVIKFLLKSVLVLDSGSYFFVISVRQICLQLENYGQILTQFYMAMCIVFSIISR